MGQKSLPIPFLDRQEIERKATELIRTAVASPLSSDAFDLARRIGVPVFFTSFDQPDVSGMLVREGGRTEIRVRSDDSYNRQNFTVAHELGHHLLSHPGTWQDTKNTMYRRSAWSDDSADRRAEYQANLFAAALLMPEQMIRERWNLLRSIHFVAPYFRVSRKAIFRRLEDLGLIVLSPKGVRFLDLSAWDTGSGIPDLPMVFDMHGPIPRFPPIATDEHGRIIPMSDEEWASRSSALTRVLRIAGDRIDETHQPETETGDFGGTER